MPFLKNSAICCNFLFVLANSQDIRYAHVKLIFVHSIQLVKKFSLLILLSQTVQFSVVLSPIVLM